MPNACISTSTKKIIMVIPPLLISILKGQGDIALSILENAEKLGLSCVKMDPESVAKRQACIQSIWADSYRNRAIPIIENTDELGIDTKKLLKNPNSVLTYISKANSKISCALIDNVEKLGINMNQGFWTNVLLDAIYLANMPVVSKIIDCAESLELDINKQDVNGDNALLIAIKKGEDKITSKILENAERLGLDINAKNKDGDTAIDLAKSTGKDFFVQVISKKLGLNTNPKPENSANVNLVGE